MSKALVLTNKRTVTKTVIEPVPIPMVYGEAKKFTLFTEQSVSGKGDYYVEFRIDSEHNGQVNIALYFDRANVIAIRDEFTNLLNRVG